MTRAVPFLFAVLLAFDARSLESPEAPTVNAWHAGLNIRTGLGTHFLRIDGGVQLGALDLVAVIDPLFWTDGQLDTDLLVGWRFAGAPPSLAPLLHGWSVRGGWRGTRVSIGSDAQWQQKLVLALTGGLPPITSFLRAEWGLELATVLVKHGGGLPTEVLSFASTRHFIDLVNFGMFVRLEFVSAL